VLLHGGTIITWYLGSLIVDLLYMVLDPRVRYG